MYTETILQSVSLSRDSVDGGLMFQQCVQDRMVDSSGWQRKKEDVEVLHVCTHVHYLLFLQTTWYIMLSQVKQVETFVLPCLVLKCLRRLYAAN